MSAPGLFPFQEYWWFYGTFSIFVLYLLALDLGIFHRKAHEVTLREAAISSAVWVSLALLFCGALYAYCLWTFPSDPRLAGLPGALNGSLARQTALEFLAGFIMEKSLSLDNVFIFAVVFQFFAIPAKYQHRILFFGIVGALLFRVIFVALGAVLLRYQIVIVLFGIFLIATGIKILFASPQTTNPEQNILFRLLRRLIPVHPGITGQHFFTRLGSRLQATPLLIALVFLEATDIIFAVDSIPAIFALTNEPLIVFSSNVFAILGLRSLYFLVAGVIPKFRLLKYGLGVMLVFIGLKMAWLNHLFGGKFPIGWSLGIIAGILAISITASLLTSGRSAALQSASEPRRFDRPARSNTRGSEL